MKPLCLWLQVTSEECKKVVKTDSLDDIFTLGNTVSFGRKVLGKPVRQVNVKKNEKKFPIFGNPREIWVSVFGQQT